MKIEFKDNTTTLEVYDRTWYPERDLFFKINNEIVYLREDQLRSLSKSIMNYTNGGKIK